MAELRFTILGCGSSGGVPRLGGHWGRCACRGGERRIQILGRAVECRHRSHADGQEDEQRGEDRRGPGQQVGRSACGDEPGRIATPCEAAAFRPLHQDDAHQGCGDDGVNDEQKFEKHGRPGCWKGWPAP